MLLDLSCGAMTAAVDTRGGELVSLRDGAGTEYIWSGDPAYWSGRNPILFPIVGGLKNGAVRFQGRSYTMSRHGFARHMEFDLVCHGPDHTVLQLTDSPDTLTQYPYPFRLQVEHRLTENGFTTEFSVQNTGSGPMPFCIGGHTAYRCPLRTGERFEDYRLVFDGMETADTICLLPGGILSHDRREPVLKSSNTIELRHEIFDRTDTLIFDGLRSQGVRLVHKDTGRGVHVDFGDFPMVGFWTVPGKAAPYICIEPWQGCAAFDNESGDFEDKPHRVILAPGEEKRLRYTVHIL